MAAGGARAPAGASAARQAVAAAAAAAVVTQAELAGPAAGACTRPCKTRALAAPLRRPLGPPAGQSASANAQPAGRPDRRPACPRPACCAGPRRPWPPRACSWRQPAGDRGSAAPGCHMPRPLSRGPPLARSQCFTTRGGGPRRRRASRARRSLGESRKQRRGVPGGACSACMRAPTVSHMAHAPLGLCSRGECTGYRGRSASSRWVRVGWGGPRTQAGGVPLPRRGACAHACAFAAGAPRGDAWVAW
jgi:hypothetical protein